mgnify:CR=1 FL=1
MIIKQMVMKNKFSLPSVFIFMQWPNIFVLSKFFINFVVEKYLVYVFDY